MISSIELSRALVKFSKRSALMTYKRYTIGGLSRLFSSNSLINSFPEANPVDSMLYEELRQWRLRTSEELQKPVYSILPNKVLIDIAMIRPMNIEQFVGIKGIGPKTQQYSSSIFEIVKKYPHVNLDFSDEKIDPNVWKVNPVIKEKKSATKKVTVKKSSLPANYVPPMKKIEKSELNDEKIAAAELALNGNNVFLSGSAGTGKSFLLSYLIQELKEKHGDSAIAVTAPTGVAAINIGGQTLHSFSGIGLGTGARSNIISKVISTEKSRNRWMKTKVLCIDEVSMLSRELFELLDEIARAVKQNDLPFGGIQIILVGDFFQLPPVQSGADRGYCFQCKLWEQTGLNKPSGQVFLKDIVRQKDYDFIRILNDIRIGKISPDLKPLLDACVTSRKPKPDDGIIPTKLYCINKDVDSENINNLKALPGETVVIEASDEWRNSPTSDKKRILLDMADKAIPKKIELKIGAQVMLLRNRNQALENSGSAGDKHKVLGLVNGSRGVVTGFVKSALGGIVPTIRFDNGKVITIGKVEYTIMTPDYDCIVRKQLPLKLAWAITVHKSQGSTLTRAELALENSFDFGQAYVALSRVTDLNGLWLTKPFTEKSIKVNPLVLHHFGSTAQ